MSGKYWYFEDEVLVGASFDSSTVNQNFIGLLLDTLTRLAANFQPSLQIRRNTFLLIRI